MTLAEYEDSVGPKNQRYHEVAESIRLAKEGVIPVEDDPTDGLDGELDDVNEDL